jgi:hypothetical protein
MGVKLGVSANGKNIGLGVSRIGCGGRYVKLKGRKLKSPK